MRAGAVAHALDAQLGQLRAKLLSEFLDGNVLTANSFYGRTQEVGNGNPGDGHRVLEREKDPFTGALLRVQLEPPSLERYMPPLGVMPGFWLPMAASFSPSADEATLPQY